MKSPFVSMFPLPPSDPTGKSGDVVSFLNPVTETPDVMIDFGIVDAVYFALSPNESKKFNDSVMNIYNYINLVDAIYLIGAKCYLDWETKISDEIKIIHKEYIKPGVADRTIYKSRDLGRNAQVDPSRPAPPTNDYAQPCTMVEGETTAKYPPETRKWIHHTRGIHPLVDNKIIDLDLYKPVSEHMGENVITYNSDTVAVDIDDWPKPTKTEKNIINPECVFAYGTPHCLREIIRERMEDDWPDEINKGWTQLNELMARNLPIETKIQTEAGTGLWTEGPRDPKEPHGLVMINDFYHWIDRIDPIKIPVADDLYAYLKDACQLVNHMYPLINKVRSELRNYKYEPILSKTVDNEWIVYEYTGKTFRVTGERGEPAPIDIDYVLDKWGYEATQPILQDWIVNVGLAIEETFPRKKAGTGTFEADMNGNKIKGTITNIVDNQHFVPEIIELPLG